MQVTGKAVYKGIAMGPVVILKNKDLKIKRENIEKAQAEMERLEDA